MVVLVTYTAPSLGVEPVAGETGRSGTSRESAFAATQVVEDGCATMRGLEDANRVEIRARGSTAHARRGSAGSGVNFYFRVYCRGAVVL